MIWVDFKLAGCMRKLVALLLLFSLISGTTIIGEFLKLPVVFIHYAEHQREVNKISVIDFLLCHYVEDAHEIQDNDIERDHSLPFKSDELVHAHFSLYLTDGSEGFEYLNTSEFHHLPYMFAATQVYQSDFWRPPVL